MLRFVFIVAVASVVATTIPAYLISHRSQFVTARAHIDRRPTATSATKVSSAYAALAQRPIYSGRKVELATDGRGNFVSDFRLDGLRVTGVVDTGASTVAINATTARRIGIALAPSDFRYDVQTANGHAKAAAATIDEIEIGRIRVDNVPAMVLEDDSLSTALVGMSFLSRLSHFQVEGGRLVLVQ